MSKLSFSARPYIVVIGSVIILAGAVACGSRASAPKAAGTRATSAPTVTSAETTPAGAAPDGATDLRMLAWYCPESAAGRPGLELLMAQDPIWDADAKSLQAAVATRRVKRFSVMAWDGRRAGSFSVAGAARSQGRDLAVGSYLGSPPCAPPSGPAGTPVAEDPTCVRELAGCALAVGDMEPPGGFQSRPYEEDPDTGVYAAGEACEVGDELVVDMDGDGASEHFSIAGLRAAADAPSELPYLPGGTASCSADFARSVASNPPLTRVAVIDLNRDGRPEIVYRRGSEFLLYGAPNQPARLELLARRVLTSAPQ